MGSTLSTPHIATIANQLVQWFGVQHQYVVALSGGVDSAVVACAARLSGNELLAVTGVGPANSERERADVARIVELLDLNHKWLNTDEFQNADYVRNDLQRCFHCKSHLFAAIAKQLPGWQILTGTNSDDLGDYRPGLAAAANANARAPMVEMGIDKQTVRQLASYWRIPIADKPASPCLASRIAYGVPVTAERLKRIEAAEHFLRQLKGVTDCRVRLHADDIARIELPPEQIAVMHDRSTAMSVVQHLQELGFRFVTVDLAGLKSGSLNPPELYQVELSSADLS